MTTQNRPQEFQISAQTSTDLSRCYFAGLFFLNKNVWYTHLHCFFGSTAPQIPEQSLSVSRISAGWEFPSVGVFASEFGQERFDWSMEQNACKLVHLASAPMMTDSSRSHLLHPLHCWEDASEITKNILHAVKTAVVCPWIWTEIRSLHRQKEDGVQNSLGSLDSPVLGRMEKHSWQNLFKRRYC